MNADYAIWGGESGGPEDLFLVGVGSPMGRDNFLEGRAEWGNQTVQVYRKHDTAVWM